MVKREVIGAHYGLRDWLMQRITAVVMVIYTALLILFVIQASQGGYANWQALFAYTWVKVVTSITFIALLIHAWVGIRDVWMDYIQHVGIRLTMHVLTILWLVGSLIYSFQVVWGS
jgi:succinate dehydrogenase / fumarate reductase membrane anchor subunit